MASNVVDVRTPIFYRHSFASVLETQSSKAYFRLTHTPLIAEHLPRGAASGARIEQFASAHLHTLEDLEKVLRAVLEETANEQSYASLCRPVLSAVPTRDGLAGDNVHEAATTSSATAAANSSPSTLVQRGAAAPEQASSISPRRLPRTVSFPSKPLHAESPSGLETEQSGPSAPGAPPKPTSTTSATAASAAAAASTVRNVCARVWRGLCSVLASPWQDEVDSNPASAAQSARIAPLLPHATLNTSIGVTGVTRVPVRTARGGVPPWVKAAFAPYFIALVPQPVVSMRSSSMAAPSPHRAPPPPASLLAVPVFEASAPHAGAAAPGGGRDGAADPHAAAAPLGQEASVRIIRPAELLLATTAYESSYRAAPEETRRTEAELEDEDAASSHTTQTPHSRSLGPSPVGHGPSGMPEPNQLDLSAPSSAACSTAMPQHEGSERGQWGGIGDTSGDGSAPPSASVTTRIASLTVPPAASTVPSPGTDTRAAPSRGSGSSAEERPLPLSHRRRESSRSRDGGVRSSGAASDLTSAGPSLSFSHTWYGLGGGGEANTAAAQSLPILTSASTLMPPRGGTSAIGSWDRHAYGTELVGWLHLLVWVRWQVIHFLRDLSGVQGYVAWSAWYWSWAQEHPRQAAFHQALASVSFWRGMWNRGLHAQLTQVQYEISRHMFTLKSVFQLIVSYIGAAYTALEQLNTLVTQLQRRCEVMMSPVAATAAEAVARTSGGSTWTAGGATAGSSLTASPLHNGHGGPHRNAAANTGYDLFTNQNSIFWSPLVSGPAGVSEAAPSREGTTRDVFSSPYGLGQSVFGGVVPPRAGPHDDVDRESAATALEEGVEAASSLHAMDELRRAVWSMLQELKVMFCPEGLRLDALEGADHVRFPWGVGGGGGGGLDASMAAGQDGHGAVPRRNENILFGASVLGEEAAVTAAAATTTANAGAGQHSGVQVHFADSAGPGTRDGSDAGGSRQPAVRDGAQVLLLCVQRSQLLLRRLTTLVQRSHCPPTSRHWRRMLVATATIVPPFFWLYTKSPAELTAVAERAVKLGRQMARSYVLEPVAQLRESLFYVRPGVEDRRGAFDRDATSLANIIRDFHEDMYPEMAQVRLEELRARTLERLRAGVADPDGFGLIDEQYRHAVRHPIRSVILGDLPRIMLIQLSYQALEVSRVANGIDEVLEGNDINFKIMAMMPVFLAGGLLATWSLFRFRVMYKPVRLRMKLLWRSLFRVVSFAGNGQEIVPPFLRLSVQQGGRHRTEAVATVMDFPRATPNLAGTVSRLRKKADEGHQQQQQQRRRKATTAAGTSPPRYGGSANSRDADDADTAAFSESRSDRESDTVSSSEADTATTTTNTSVGAGASARQLNNYEQGMVLLLSHVMRSMASEYLRSYAFFHELMEDLNDLESVQSTRHQRLATLERMRATHTTFF